MEKVHAFIRKIVLSVVDAFYPLFRKFMPLQTFRYAACGGANMILDIVIFTYCYNFIANRDIVYIGNFALKPFVFALVVSFCISFPVGFYLSRYIVWQETQTKKRIQVFRYFLVVGACLGLNYLFMNIFVEEFHWWPTVAKLITTVFVVLFSYFSQRNFSFRTKKIKGKKIEEIEPID